MLWVSVANCTCQSIIEHVFKRQNITEMNIRWCKNIIYTTARYNFTEDALCPSVDKYFNPEEVNKYFQHQEKLIF